jgi:hypothetical protein
MNLGQQKQHWIARKKLIVQNLLYSPLMQFAFFTLARMLRTSKPFTLFEFCFFSLKDNIHGHLLMKIFISKLCPLQCNSGHNEG